MKLKRLLSILFAIVLSLSSIPFNCLISLAKTIEEYEVGDIISFGSYPQSEVTDKALIKELEKIILDYSIWTSYGYYSGTGVEYDGEMTAKDYMKYTDISYGGSKYRAVKISSYRPSCTGYSIGYYNYYDKDNIYFFKFEPIEWRILDPVEGLVMSERLIDSQAYNNYIILSQGELFGNESCTYYASDYANSSIREWLNKDFFNTSFTPDEKLKIKSSKCYNNSTCSGLYNSEPTYDNVFLLSYQEILCKKYGFSPDTNVYDPERKAVGTDYAKCQGLNDRYDGSNGCSYWRLRTNGDSFETWGVDIDGCVMTQMDIGYTYIGIRPAIRLNNEITIEICKHLNIECQIDEATCENNGYKYYYCNDCKELVNKEVIEAYGHSFSEWVDVNYDSLSGEYLRKRVCLRCEKEETEVVKTNHAHKYLNHYCSVCGKFESNFTGMAKSDTRWYYVKNGNADVTYTGMAKNQYGWFYFSKGKIDSYYTGMAKNEYGWFYFNNGKLDTNYTGMAKNQYGWWYFKNGKLDKTYTGLAKNQYGWWYFKNGSINYDYKGLVKNQYGWWYVQNGTINYKYNGKASNQYGTWTVKNGKVVK